MDPEKSIDQVINKRVDESLIDVNNESPKKESFDLLIACHNYYENSYAKAKDVYFALKSRSEVCVKEQKPIIISNIDTRLNQYIIKIAAGTAVSIPLMIIQPVLMFVYVAGVLGYSVKEFYKIEKDFDRIPGVKIEHDNLFALPENLWLERIESLKENIGEKASKVYN